MIALGFGLVLFAALCLALFSRRGHHEADPRAFFAAHGQFGVVLFFLLSVGETYSIGSLLGFPGGIAATGSIDIVLWFVGYILLAFPVGFFLYPALWRAGRRSGAITLPDLVGAHYRSRIAEWLTGLVLVMLMLPMGTMQFVGLAGVLSRLGLGFSPLVLAGSAAFMAFLFVAIAGLRAAALISVLKDTLVLLAILLVAGLTLWHFSAEQSRGLAESLSSGGESASSACAMIMSTIIVQAVGFCVAPQAVAAIFSARSPAVIRRAQVWMPLYMALFPLLFVVAAYGMTHAGLGGTPDQIFLAVTSRSLPGWVAGIVYGAVALTALVWLGSVCLSLAAIVTRNIVPHVPPAQQKRVGLLVIASYLVFAVATAAMHPVLLVSLNKLFYVGLVQMLPGVLACVAGWRVAPLFYLGGLGAGLATGFGLAASQASLGGLNPSVPALAVNAVVMALGWGFSRRMLR
ncbi:sodium:solute symporter [Asaia sp. W19]|uniref:sodium:solute symporter family transporter n=1 Tax=unclassified Asaia TaxID=2685023 RepID=UPI000F8C8E11|nr:sodium:solute symporter [Asaia sp. W19]RUT24936.1 sodium:solute symporter [Asaia sp. W19]